MVKSRKLILIFLLLMLFTCWEKREDMNWEKLIDALNVIGKMNDTGTIFD